MFAAESSGLDPYSLHVHGPFFLARRRMRGLCVEVMKEDMHLQAGETTLELQSIWGLAVGWQSGLSQKGVVCKPRSHSIYESALRF